MFIQTLLTSLLFYTYYRALPSSGELRKPSLRSKVVAGTHAAITASLSSLYLWGRMDQSTWAGLQFIPSGYLLYDLFLIYAEEELYLKVQGGIVAHHLIFFLFSYFWFQAYPDLLSTAFLSEWSSPFLYTCYYLIQTGRRESLAFKVSAALTLVTYFVFRVCVFTYLMWYALTRTHLLEAPFITCIWLLNLEWFRRLIRQAK